MKKNPGSMILFLVDGLKPDGLTAANTPVIDRIIQSGASSFKAKTVYPSITFPTHTSLFTSTLPTTHGVISNDWLTLPPSCKKLINSSLTSVIKKEGGKTVSFYNWEVLRELSPPGSLDCAVFFDNNKLSEGDNLMAETAALWFKNNSFTFAFIYFGHLDTVGHEKGWMSDAYIEAMSNVDQCIKTVMDAVPEKTTIIITSDHGGHGKNHGTKSKEDMTIPFIIKGPGIPQNHTIRHKINIIDIAPTILNKLNMEIPRNWEGKAVTFKRPTKTVIQSTKMKVLICPDTFKGTLSANTAAQAIEEGIKKVSTAVTTCSIPMTGGGQGALEAVRACTYTKTIKKVVRGPLGNKVNAEYLVYEDKKGNPPKAFIEMAQASGISLIQKKDHNPLLATTYGVGELIADALDKGCHDIDIGLGGSGTNDGGMGMAQALGVRFMDNENREISFRKNKGYSGGSLKYVEKIDTTSIHPKIANTKFVVVSDVVNPLVGVSGATNINGPQKGLKAEMIDELDGHLKKYAKVIQHDLGINVLNVPGAGAAGGLGAGMLAFMRASITSGINWYLKLSGFEAVVKDCDLVITGEGKIDHQTIHGKTIQGVAQMANLHRVPVMALGGCLGEGHEPLKSLGIDLVYDVSEGKCPDDDLLKKEAYNMLKKGAQKAFAGYIKS